MARYLKSLTLHGFKSFPVKTAVEFVDGITGIVGANGSGKSNIVEAIRWVLGEQSARSLRGDKMEDVIFNGTRDRPAISMAEVSLDFNNENHWLPIEYSEVNVARRIFRSGEGHYSINKSKVRLKDVIELFLDTGIGRDSYAIFEQGKIDRLLSESPQERRILFEDFAGISKFKFRKEEAERKLENSRANIERINDIIVELEKEVLSLKEQAENAQNYNELKSKLREMELKFEALRKRNFEKEINDKLKQKRMTEEKLKPVLEDFQRKESDIIQVEENIIKMEEEFNKIRDEYVVIEKDFSEIKSRLEGNRERILSYENQLRNVNQRLAEGGEREKKLREELETKVSEYDNFVKERERASERLKEIQEKIDLLYSGKKKCEDIILDQSRQLGFSKIVTKEDVDKNKQDVVALQTKQDGYRISLEGKWNSIKSIESQIKDKKGQLNILSQTMENLREELKKVLEEIEWNQREEDNLKKRNNQLNQEIKELQEESKKLDNLIISSLEKQALMLKEFSIKKPELERVIENGFSEIIERIKKGESVEEIKKSIFALKEHFGAYKGEYERILGILFSDEGAYTQKESLQKKQEEAFREIEQNEVKIEEIRGIIKKSQEIREKIQNEYNKNDFEFNGIQSEIEKLNRQLNEDHGAFKTIENQINDTAEVIKRKQKLVEDLSLIINEYEEGLQKLREEQGEFFEELNSRKIEHARLDEKCKSLQSEIQRIKNQMTDIEDMKKTYENDKNNYVKNIEGLKERIDNDEKEFDRYTEMVKKSQRDIEEKKEQIDGLHKTRKSLEVQRKNIEDNIQKLEKMVSNLDNAVSERKGYLESLIQNVESNYGVNINTIKVDEGDSFDEISKEIVLLRERILKLGNVNLLAIEQYQSARERLDFLNMQKQDSEKAMQDIIRLIDETNAKCVEQFVSSFEDIRKAFKKIFARLFDGGKADLILEDEKDVLNCGVNIFAEPPGKKFQNISLLSGGERALVAISVIFSILYLKPTPFVVLDEMDAPLDDDNIERFKALLKDFKETSQFIIVSHSKSTLEICDALYGVTMEEQGVSKVVNVAFNEADVLFKDIENS